MFIGRKKNNLILPPRTSSVSCQTIIAVMTAAIDSRMLKAIPWDTQGHGDSTTSRKMFGSSKSSTSRPVTWPSRGVVSQSLSVGWTGVDITILGLAQPEGRGGGGGGGGGEEEEEEVSLERVRQGS